MNTDYGDQDESNGIATDSTEMKRVTRKCYAQLYANKEQLRQHGNIPQKT